MAKLVWEPAQVHGHNDTVLLDPEGIFTFCFLISVCLLADDKHALCCSLYYGAMEVAESLACITSQTQTHYNGCTIACMHQYPVQIHYNGCSAACSTDGAVLVSDITMTCNLVWYDNASPDTDRIQLPIMERGVQHDAAPDAQ